VAYSTYFVRLLVNSSQIRRWEFGQDSAIPAEIEAQVCNAIVILDEGDVLEVETDYPGGIINARFTAVKISDDGLVGCNYDGGT
jgi:hypothetical protein